MKDASFESDKTEMILENAEGIKRQLYFENPDIIETNAILDELESFANSIINKEKPIVDFNDGYLALHTAQRIIESY